MDNKSKIDRIHELLPKHFNSNSTTNPNWKALVAAIGEVDQNTADLVTEVRKQFFVKTAARPYLDRLAGNNKISRPRLVGMDDTSFRDYIPVLSYQPKQVKLIVDQLLDIFFFKESTTAFITTQMAAPYALANGWELELSVDENTTERVVFTTSDFTNIAAAGADEVIAAINRQTKNCFATSYYDSITKNTYIKMFTKTIGSKGSLRVLGGRANIPLRWNGFINAAGNGANTQWLVTKIGNLTTFQYILGDSPGIDKLAIGDIIIINLLNNKGSFVITNIDISANTISFINLFATPGTYTQTSVTDVKFLSPQKYVAYTSARRAMTWETAPGEITVEMPTSPPVVKRSLAGSWHLNGVFSLMSNRDTNTSLSVVNATGFPETGSFWLEQKNEIKSRWISQSENTPVSTTTTTRLQYENKKFEYASRVALATTGDTTIGSLQITNLASTVGIFPGQDIIMPGIVAYAQVLSVVGPIVNISVAATATAVGQPVKFLGNTLTGITPNLPILADFNEFALSSVVRAANTVTVTTTTNHNYVVGDYAIISGCSGVDVATTTGNIVLNSNTLSGLASISGIAPGMLIRMVGVPVGTSVVSVAGFTVIMSTQATATTIGGVVIFSEDLNVAGKILTTSMGNTFTFQLLGTNGAAVTPGSVRMEKVGLANTGSKVIITDAVVREVSRTTGAYIWDLTAAFVLSSNTASITEEIKAGKIVRLLGLTDNTIESGENGGFVILDYGLNTQEGPVRYLYKPTPNTIAIDPSYVFQKRHLSGGSIVSIRHKGPHIMSAHGAEYPLYITNPSEARFILQNLIRSVKSAGIFVNFLVRYPEQLYATLDVYQSGDDPG